MMVVSTGAATAEYFTYAPMAGFDVSFLRFSYMLPVPLQTQTMALEQNVYSRSVTPTLASVMIGISIPSESASSFLRLRAYGGYAYATVQTKEQTADLPAIERMYEGSGNAAEVNAAICLGNTLEIGVNYRYTRINELGLSMDTDLNNNSTIDPDEVKGTVLKDDGGNAIPFDFGGINVSIAIRFGGVNSEE